MIELIVAAVFFIILGLVLLYRVFAGPTLADRLLAADSIDILITIALILYAMYSGRGMFVDIAIVTALFGFVGTVFGARYLEGKL
ncbi:MAG: cation:proton antiporter [Lachnospiraceae bacterium]|nr:cation:proton antiporter [Lachnospiraceae bacterium]